MEVDILADGSLDLEDEMLAGLDLVLVSLHSRFDLPEAQQTARVLRALEHPEVSIFCHPTARLINRRRPVEMDMDAVLRRAAELGVAVELNSNPHRLDLKDSHLRLAKELGGKVVISTDSHRIRELDLMRLWHRAGAAGLAGAAERFEHAAVSGADRSPSMMRYLAILMPRPSSARLVGAILLAHMPAAAQDLASFEARTTVHKLANGWTFLIVERPVAPVFSFCTIADVGSAQEVPGITGLAHMFEHMAFKGGPTVGTRDWEGEKKALAELEAAYQAWQAERLAARPDPKKLETLAAELRRRQEVATRFIVPNELDDIMSREGGVDLNATTGADDTQYYYSLPSNKFELVALIESERFAHPVFREFYEERDVVQEERRQRLEGSGFGRLFEQFGITAFDAHPYKQPGAGYMSDLQSITITDAEKFFQTYYAPSNLITAIVGDVQARTVIPILEKYFGRIPARPAPPPLRTVEPPQKAEKIVILEDPSQPMVLEAYHKPAVTHPDHPVWGRSTMSCRTAAPRGSTALWCGTRRSPWRSIPSRAFRARSTRISGPRSWCPPSAPPMSRSRRRCAPSSSGCAPRT